MSKDFYAVLAQQLCSIKNSPFSLLSQQMNQSMASSNILKSNKLSYDPDRYFNPDKKRERIEEDQAYIEIEKQQKEDLQRIQIQLLKEKTHEELLKLKQKSELSKQYNFSHPFSIFKVSRTVCMNCTKCFQYNGNFNIGSTLKIEGTSQQVEYLQCMTCGCPMNSHEAILSKNKFSLQIFNYLSTTVLEDNMLNMNCFPLCFLASDSKKIGQIVSNMLNYMPQLGFKIISQKTINTKEFELFMIKKEILTGVEKQTVEKLMTFVSFLQSQQNFEWDHQLPQEVDQQYFQIVKKLRNQIKMNFSKSDSIIVLFLSSVNQLEYQEVNQIIEHYSPSIGAKLLWTPKQIKEKFITSCILFPQHYQLQHQIFILPSQPTNQQMEKVSCRFKDLLDYNNYVTIGQIKKIETQKLEEILKHQDHNQLDYIMGTDQVNDTVKRLRILLAAKVGPSIFTVPFKNAVDFIQISSQQRKASFMMAFPEYLRSQRCILILRPCFTLSNLQQIIMTLLRVNNFILLKRRKVILSSQQAQYLAALQKIDEKSLPNYVKMMTSGASEIVLVSKRGAIYESNILLNGSRDSISETKVKTIKQIPMIKIKRGTQTYEYQPILKTYQNQKKECFSSISELFKVQNVLFPRKTDQIKFMTNQKNGQVIKFINEPKTIKQMKLTSKMKESFLTEIKSDTFNYWVYSSKSQLMTEQLAGIFMPQTTLFQSCVVIVKPGFVHLAQKIKKSLVQHRYHIIMEKTVLLSQKLAYQMLINLRKMSASSSQIKKYVDAYSSENIHIFCVSKVFAKQQIFSILSDFSFLSSRSTIVTEYVDDSLLKQVLIPVWNNQQFVLRILSAPLYNIEEAINSLYTPDISNQDKFQILKYMIGSYYGVSVEDLSLNSVIGKFSYYITSGYVANLQSWYYSEISKLNSRYVPTLFQHRTIGQACFIIQSYNGFPFLNLISTQYEEEKQKVNELPNKESRKSLILFLWGKQLSQFILSICEKESNMKGWGQLVKKNQEWQGKTSQRQLYDLQKEFLQDCSQQFQNQDYEIYLHVKKVLDSRFLNQKYIKQSRRRLIPYFIEGKIDQCIRIIETQEISKLHLIDKYSMIDPQHEKSNDKSLYTLSLYNVEPSIGTKEELVVQIMLFLIKLQRDNEEYRKMFSLLFEYFVQNVIEHTETDIIECQFYIRLLKQYTRTNQEWIKTKLRTYPNLKKLIAINQTSNDQVSGKKRKFLEKRQYYRDINSNLTEQQLHIKNKQYRTFNLNYEAQQKEKEIDQNNPLLNMKDPFHRKITVQERPITLLREQKQAKKEKTGIYVEFEKKISQNEELLMNKVKGQVEKFNLQKEDKILYETGLQDQLWYRKTKGQKAVSGKSKVDDAIQKQISKLMQFKKIESNEFYQTR